LAQQNQIIKPRSINLDSSKKYLKDTEAAYLLNFDVQNPSALGKGVPFAANFAICELELPLGENYNNGRYYSPITNEEYSWTWNSNGINFISRINGDGVCQIVYSNNGSTNCLSLSADPKHEITRWRAYLYVEKSDCANRHGKYLCWTNGESFIGWLDVEASIATNYFSTPFFDSCRNGCELISLCVPQPCSCISAEYIPLESTDQSITNNIVDKSFKFIYRGVYYDKIRRSEWSDPSTVYFEDTDNCFYNSKGVSRCIKLRIPIDNPMWDKIEIGFSKGDIDGNGDGVWYLADTIDVYEKYNSTQQYWYQRELSPELLHYENCSFDYLFCNNKQCQIIDIAEVTRVFNPIPLQPQGMISIKDGLGFYNYEQGNCPIDENQAAKFTISTVAQQSTDCIPEMRSLKVRAIIHSRETKFNQFIWRKGGELTDSDDVTDTAYFGGFQSVPMGSLPDSLVINTGRKQSFVDRTRGFIVYVEGSEYFAQMKQYVAGNGFIDNGLVGVLGGGSKTTFPQQRMDDRNANIYYYQEAEILIPKGMKGFLRIASCKATGLEPDTSTKLAGTISDITNYASNIDLPSFNQFQFEIPFQCEDTDLKTAFIINDATLTNYTGVGSSVETVGYIKDNIGIPLEGLEIWADFDGLTGGSRILAKTDHNGYFNYYSQTGQVKNSTAQIRAEIDCSTWNKLQSITLNRSNHNNEGTLVSNVTIANTDWLTKKFQQVTAKVIDCNGNPVQGIKVAFSGSKAQVTQSDGTVYIKARNYSTRDRQATAIVMSKYGCYTVDCSGNCNPCYPSQTNSTPTCYVGGNTVMTAMQISLKAALKNQVGLKAGGNYPFGFVIQGDCGKISAVNELPYIQIDKTQKKGKYSFDTFAYNAAGMELPDWASCVKIVRGVNLNNYELQWLVDKVEKTADRKLKITIQSLNDYNSKYFFKTNTNYQYLAGDRVEFIRNGDGKIFDIPTHGLLNYQILSPFLDQLATGQTTSAANYFNQILIDDDGKLGDLKEGALIELQRSKECTTQPIYFSICASIPTTVDGNGITKLISETGNFTTFDTYFVQRQVGDFSVQTFESKTPSDFWGGTGIDDTGKPYFVNKYETQKRYGRNISIALHNEINRFGDLVKTFEAPEQGDITAMNIVDGRVILAIGENDSFLAEASNNLVRVGSDGVIRAATPDQIISDAEPKLRGQFGCQYEDIGSVFFGDGFATWVDGNKNAHVVHNYNEAKDMSFGKMQTYFRSKIQLKNLVNSITGVNDLDRMRWITGQNKVNKSVFLTIKSLRQAEINNDIKPFVSPNSTISFNVDAELYLTFHSETPEAFSELNLKDEMGSAYIVYYKSIPYLHPIKTTKWNEFFGQSVDTIASLSFNKFPEKLKNFIAVEIQSDQRWYVKLVETNDPNFQSEIPPKPMTAVGDKWNGGLLGNKNSTEGLFSGRMPSGYYCLITFIKNNTINLVYNSISDLERETYSEVDLFNCKFNLLEQSGFTENL
jgi:hypothetical protein